MSARLPLAAAVLAALFATGASACDIGVVPDPVLAALPVEVIAMGHADTATQARDAASGRTVASAEIAIDRVARGEFSARTWRLEYPVKTDFYSCDLSERPALHASERVALHFKRVDGKLMLADWFLAEAAAADPRRPEEGVSR